MGARDVDRMEMRVHQLEMRVERLGKDLVEAKRRHVKVETALIWENTELGKRVWALLRKYEPETVAALKEKR